MISRYFADFEYKIIGLDFILGSEVSKRKINNFLGIIESKLFFEKGILEILEVIIIIDGQLIKKKYKYHFQNQAGGMIFRYDNAPHHQSITTFPHHKHVQNSIVESIEPDILVIISEVKGMLDALIK